MTEPLPSWLSNANSLWRRGERSPFWAEPPDEVMVGDLVCLDVPVQGERDFYHIALRQAHGLELAERRLRDGLAAAGLGEKELRGTLGRTQGKSFWPSCSGAGRPFRKFGWPRDWGCVVRPM